MTQGPVLKRLGVLFGELGGGSSDYIGEPVSISAHSLQAGHIAKQHFISLNTTIDCELVLASLLHDIGHMLGIEAGSMQELQMEDCGIRNHETIGSQFALQLGFTPRVAELIRNHVSAKRYLCWKYPDYHAKLSSASRTTLRHQGGPMSSAEAEEFEKHADFQNCLLMRTFDEAAKEPDAEVPPLDSYADMIQQNLSSNQSSNSYSSSNSLSGRYMLSDFQKEFYQKNSFLKIRNLLQYQDISAVLLQQWVAEVAQWPANEPGKWLSHFELLSLPAPPPPSQSSPSTEPAVSSTVSVEKVRVLCRNENFVNYHSGLSDLSRGVHSDLQAAVTQVLGEPAVLFKEKINYKLAGGGGFAAHQDTPAYIGLARDHITAMVAVDPATRLNGCLEIAAGRFGPIGAEREPAGEREQGWGPMQSVQLKPTGCLCDEDEDRLTFQHVECAAGDVLIFSGYVPHRSASNGSGESRRAVFFTYNPSSQGDHHDIYYAAKHAGKNGFSSSKAISFHQDFLGEIVE
eukprot:gene32356-41923_t